MRYLWAFLLFLPVLCAQTCAPADPLHPVDSLKATINDGNCRLSDGSYYAEYFLVLPTRGQLQLDGASSDFSLTLLLRDDAGRKIDAGSSIQRTVERGRYSVIVNSTMAGQTGDFTLHSSFTAEPRTLCRSFSHVGLNQSVTGSLTASSCRLPDGTAFDGYLLHTFGSGTLQVAINSTDFNPYLILRDESGHQVASDGAGISAPIQSDATYTIVAAAADTGTGNYSLSVSFTQADNDTCRPAKSFAGSGQDQGKVSSTSCVQTEPLTGDQILYNYYTLQVTDAGSAELRLSSPAFDPLLLLIDASGNVVDSDATSGGKGKAIIRHQLRPGNYTVLAFSSQSAGGDYTLQYTFRPGPPETCPVLSLQPAAPATGALSGAASCRTSQGMSDVYRVVTPADGTLEIAMSSVDFGAFLGLRDDKDNLIVADDNGGGRDSRIVADLPAGTYSVVAASVDVPGNYTLTYKLTPHTLAACSTVQKLDLNSAFIGQLGPNSCRGKNGQPIDYYEFTTPADGTVAAVMTSSDLNSFLTVEDTQGNILRRDDNSYGGQDAIITQFLPAQTYRLGARAAGTDPGGFYRIDLLASPGDRPPGCTPASTLAVGDSVNAQLNFTACEYLDDTFADIYQLNVANTAVIQIHLDTDQFDAYLQLLDLKGNVIDQDDNSDGGSNARISHSLDPGTYWIVAKPFSGFSSTGAYSLKTNSVQ